MPIKNPPLNMHQSLKTSPSFIDSKTATKPSWFSLLFTGIYIQKRHIEMTKTNKNGFGDHSF